MKRRLWLAVVVLDVLGIALIPLNLFALQMPEAVTLIFVPAAAVLNVLLWRGGTGGRGAKAALSLLSLAAAALTLFGAYCNPYWNSNTFRADALKTVRDDAMVLTGREALADLDYAMKYLKKLHPAFYRGAPPAASAQYELARQELAGMEEVDLCTLSREIEPVLATLGDAHTYALAVYRRAHRLKYLDEREAAGERVVAVNGVSVDELLAQNARLFSYETEAYGRLWAENRLRSLEGLRYLGIDTDGGVAYTFARADGTKETLTFYSDDFTVEDSGADDAPFVSYELDRGHDLAVLRLDRCVYNDAYRDCLAEFFAAYRLKKFETFASGSTISARSLIALLSESKSTELNFSIASATASALSATSLLALSAAALAALSAASAVSTSESMPASVVSTRSIVRSVFGINTADATHATTSSAASSPTPMRAQSSSFRVSVSIASASFLIFIHRTMKSLICKRRRHAENGCL